ncbi:MAG TPA: hypothetical protein VGC20_14515 [bacterium]|jgi:hypothetical protein
MHLMRTTRWIAALAGMILLSAMLGARPGTTRAQALTFFTPHKAVGVGLYYRWGYIEVEAPKSSVDLKTKGLLDTLPARMPLQGPTLGMSFGDFGFVAAYSLFDAAINKMADVDGDSVGDVDVLAVQGKSVSVSLVYQPIRHFFIGYGAYRGTLAFQIVGGGVGSTLKSATSGNFYTIALAWGIDPTLNKPQFFFTLYAAPPAGTSGEVVANSYGIGLGGFF